MPAALNFNFMLEGSQLGGISLNFMARGQTLIFINQTAEFFQSAFDKLTDTEITSFGEALLQITDPDAGVDTYFPLIRRNPPTDDIE